MHPDSPTVNRSQRARNREGAKRAFERGKSFLNIQRQDRSEPEEKKPRNRTSCIWKYVEQVTALDRKGNKVEKYQCNICGDKFACKADNTTTTRKHFI